MHTKWTQTLNTDYINDKNVHQNKDHMTIRYSDGEMYHSLWFFNTFSSQQDGRCHSMDMKCFEAKSIFIEISLFVIKGSANNISVFPPVIVSIMRVSH